MVNKLGFDAGPARQLKLSIRLINKRPTPKTGGARLIRI